MRLSWRGSPGRAPVLLAGVLIACGPGSPHDQVEEASYSGTWSPAPGMHTRWTDGVDPNHPLAEYPRPQMIRERWKSLNGLWGFATIPAERGTAQPPLEAFRDTILVPFPVESSLSGLARPVTPQERIWYRKVFSLPQAPGERSLRWLLHFGAVDWEAEVFLNGVRMGTHRGGYDPFSYEITDAIRTDGDQELVVAVWDPTDEGSQPRGKQVLEPHGIWYTAVTGIWQTVWLEPVPQDYVSGLTIIPDPESETVSITAMVRGQGPALPVTVSVSDRGPGGRPAHQARGRAGEPITLSIPTPRLWSPSDPFLYGLRVELEGGDAVESYFGMRSTAVGADEAGRPRLLLNGEPLFQFGLLDQGWWPDGLYTASSDEALRFDVETTRDLGFNLARKHVKVEPDRWYYHADRTGLLVWQDMPSGDNEGAEAREQFSRELRRIVDALRNHPSIIMWVPFNEGWGQHETEGYVDLLRSVDPTRLVNNASGWTDMGVGDVLDVHRYPGPGFPDVEAVQEGTGLRAPVLGEFGGLGLPLAGHTWVEEDNWGYRSYETTEGLNAAYADLLFQLRPLVGEGMAAAVYTQTTDVEIEVNGVMTYDREIVKLSPEAPELNRRMYEAPPVLLSVAPTSREEHIVWAYTRDAPGQGWQEPEFDDETWLRGPGGFGTAGTPGSRVGTTWDTSDLWVRRTFGLEPEALEALDPNAVYLRVHHDEDTEIYLNGALVAELGGYTTGYRLVSLGVEAFPLLRPGMNLLAAHVRNIRGGQFLDIGLVEMREGGEG